MKRSIEQILSGIKSILSVKPVHLYIMEDGEMKEIGCMMPYGRNKQLVIAPDEKTNNK
jgi:hypothetical protein